MKNKILFVLTIIGVLLLMSDSVDFFWFLATKLVGAVFVGVGVAVSGITYSGGQIE